MPLVRRDAAWHLHRYVHSFEGDDGGAEYYRLEVDAHAGELVPSWLCWQWSRGDHWYCVSPSSAC